MARELTDDERQLASDMMARARTAMAEIEDWSQRKPEPHEPSDCMVCGQ